MAEPVTLAARPQDTNRPVTSAICPYLLAEDGSWRASTPARDHRCTAVTPAAPLTAEKQRRLCLTADHRACATFQAASGDGELGSIAAVPLIRATTRSTRAMARTTPVVLDHGRFVVAVPTLGGRRAGVGQTTVIALMALAFAVLVVARLSSADGRGSGNGGLAGAGVPSASPTASTTRRPSFSPVAATASPKGTPAPTPARQSPVPSATPKATASPIVIPATYRVRSGDTLSGIAARYGTTSQALAKLNGIKDPRNLKVGQVLRLR
jgi:LysM repeat protein